MTIWQQKSLKSLLKFLGILVIIVAITVFFVYKYYYQRDALIKYAPSDSVFYMTYKIDGNFKNQLASWSASLASQGEQGGRSGAIFKAISQDIDLSKFNFNLLNQHVAHNAAFAIIPNWENQELKYDYLLIFDLKQDNSGLDQNLSIISQYNWQTDLLKNQALKKNILLVSNSANIVEQVRGIARDEKKSLGDDIKVTLKWQKLGSPSQGKVYASASPLIKNISQISDWRLKLFILSLEINENTDLFSELKEENGQIVMVNPNNSDTNGSNQLILKNLPDNLSLNLLLQNQQEAVMAAVELFKQTEPDKWTQVESKIQYWENNLKFNYDQDVLPLFKNKIQFALTNEDKYILAIEFKNNEEVDQYMAKIKQIIKEFVAFNKPTLVEKTMPDYTKINQVIKEPNKLEFQTINFANISYDYLIKDDLEFAIIKRDNQIILANNKEILEKSLTSGFMALADCENTNLSNFGQNLRLESNFIPLLSRYFKFINIGSDFKSDQFSMCIGVENLGTNSN